LGQSFEALDLPHSAKKSYAKAISAFTLLVQACPEVTEYRFGRLQAQSGGFRDWRRCCNDAQREQLAHVQPDLAWGRTQPKRAGRIPVQVRPRSGEDRSCRLSVI
jgi:hypothetical protein